jgi:hypothetical protein
MKKSILTLGLSICAMASYAQQTYNYSFANKFGRSNKNEVPKDFAIDGAQNTYTVGEFADSVDFNPGSAINSFFTNTGDFYLNKLNAAGNYGYTKIFKRNAINGGVRGVITDSQGNIYVTGCFFTGTIDCDPGAPVVNLSAISSGSQTSENFFIIKLNAAGNFVWSKQLKGALQSTTLTDRAMDIKVNKFGEVLVSSTFRSTIDFDPGTAISNMTATTSGSMFVCKLNSSGNFLWAKQVGNTTGTVSSPNMSIDTASNIVLTGNFTGTLDFNPGTATNNLTALVKNKYYLAKWNNSGAYVWALNAGGNDVRTDARSNIYYAGVFKDTLDCNPGAGVNNLISFGQGDVFLVKLKSAGTYVFSKQFGGTTNDTITTIGFDSLKRNLFLNMSFTGTADFDPSVTCVRSFTTSGASDISITKLDTSGNFLWAGQFGGTSTDVATEMGISYNSQSLFLSGRLVGTADFNPTGVTNLTSSGLADVFTCKVVQCTTACPVYAACNGADRVALGIQTASDISNKISIYPNPNKGAFTISLGKVYEKASLSITDISGRVVAQYQWNDVSNANIELKEAPGFYWIEISTESGKLERLKVLIQD